MKPFLFTQNGIYMCYPLIQVLEAFFRRALAWEKESNLQINLSEEKNGVYYFSNEIESSTEIGILLQGNETQVPFQQIRATAANFKGFDLVVTRLGEVSRQ